MKLTIAFISFFCFVFSGAYAQKYSLKTGVLSFTMSAPAGNLLAVDSSVAGYVDLSQNDMEFKVFVNDFRFISSFMPDYINTATTKRFRTYYLETEQFPNSMFKGRIDNAAEINFSKDGTYKAQISGVLTMHGVSRKITRQANIIVRGKEMRLQTEFPLTVSDFSIRTPKSIGDFFFKEVMIQANYLLRK